MMGLNMLVENVRAVSAFAKGVLIRKKELKHMPLLQRNDFHLNIWR